MATSFPTGLDAIQRVVATDLRNAPGKEGHVLHNNLCDAVEALQAKVGVDGSAVAASIDARINAAEALPGNLLAQHVAHADPHALYMLKTSHASEHAILSARASDRVIAHRGGGALVNAEYTNSALQSAVASGLKNIELDVVIKDDGMAVVMHDTTVDRTTTSSGSVLTLTNDQYKSLICDTDSVLNAPNYVRESPLFLHEALRFLVPYQETVLWIETKNTNAVNAVMAQLQAINMPKERVRIASGSSAHLSAAIANQYAASFQVSISGSPDWAAWRATGYQYIGAAYNTWTAEKVEDCHAAGLMAVAWTVNRRHEYATLISYGVDFVYSDDPLWCSGVSPISTRSPYATKTWWPGALESVTNASGRGVFGSENGEWGYDVVTANYLGCLQGWACPIKNDPECTTFNLQFELKITAVAEDTRWAGVFLCCTSDEKYTDTTSTSEPSGYHILFRKNGTIQVFRKSPGEASVSIASNSGTAFTLGSYMIVDISVNATQITISIPALSRAISVNDATQRGGFFHFGRNGAAFMIKNVVVS